MTYLVEGIIYICEYHLIAKVVYTFQNEPVSVVWKYKWATSCL